MEFSIKAFSPTSISSNIHALNAPVFLSKDILHLVSMPKHEELQNSRQNTI